MIGKMIGAMVGAKVAERSRGGVGGTGGAIVGALAPMVLRRVGIVPLAVLALGGYAASKLTGKRTTRY